MKLERRQIAILGGGVLVLAAGGAGLYAATRPAPRPAPPPQAVRGTAAPATMAATDRSIGRADAPVTVIEYFSLTCGHCAAFHRDTMPQVKRELVETGRLRIVFRDFPLDAVALAAAQVARRLPPERYEPFISMLLSTQDRWAFNRGADPKEELYRAAALAGMGRAEFDAAIADADLARTIMEERQRGQEQHAVQSTPTFVIGGRAVPGNMSYDRFAQLVAEAR